MSIIKVDGIGKEYVINLDKVCYVEIAKDKMYIVFEYGYIDFTTKSSNEGNKVTDSVFEELKKNFGIHSPYWLTKKGKKESNATETD